MESLSECFLHSLSPAPELRRPAESKLAIASDQPNYGLAVLRLVAEPSVDEGIRLAAAVNFKNHLRSRWVSSPESSLNPIGEDEKHEIKRLIVTLMLSSSIPKIQSRLSISLTLIGKHDFPKSWPNLLPELVANLDSSLRNNDYASINGILGTVNAIFKKFRYQYKTNDLLLDLKYCLDNFCAPLLFVFRKTADLIDSVVSNSGRGGSLMPIFECQRLCCRIFYSLNFLELPEFFEDNMDQWMVEFRKYLTTSYPSVESSSDGLSVVDLLRIAVCENISLYMEKNEEEFKGYVQDFALAIRTLLEKVSQSSGNDRDRLAVTAIKFLTTVSTGVKHSLFATYGDIPQICQNIVIPNMRLRDYDEELFETNYIEFIRRDMEGSDVDTRRSIACKLLKGISTNYRRQVTASVAFQVQELLKSYSANPVLNWKDKDCAIYLIVSLVTKKAEAASVFTDIVDLHKFFNTSDIT